MPDIFIDQDIEEGKKKLKEETSSQESNNAPENISEKAADSKPENAPDASNETTTSIADLNKTELLDSLGIKSHGGGLHSLSSYYEDPEKVKFSNMMEKEILLLFLRQHFITNFPWILKATALGLVPIIFEFLSALGFYSTSFVTPEGKFIIYSFYYFFILSGYVFVNYMTWFYNISLITNIRIIDIDFSQIVFEDVAATKLSQIEDVSYSQIGVFRSIFDYGDVHTQTAGTASNFEFLAVPHPENVIRIVNHLLGKGKHD